MEHLGRNNWLREHGFQTDPFPWNSFTAENDPFFSPSGMSAYVDVNSHNLDEVYGTPESQGYRFLLFPSGGGKTSLRRRIISQFDNRFTHDFAKLPKVLAVEYIDHKYGLDKSSARFHVERIGNLINEKLSDLCFDSQFDFSPRASARKLTEELLKKCRSIGIDGVCVVIDNIKDNTAERFQANWTRIESLIHSDLLNMEGLIIKFILPKRDEVRANLPNNRYPSFIMEWDQKLLAEVLQQRLVTCVAELTMVRGDTSQRSSLAELCDVTIKDTIFDKFIDYGFQKQSPRAMWHLGWFMLDEHFRQTREHGRLLSELVNRKTLTRAYSRIQKEIAAEKIKPTSGNDVHHQLTEIDKSENRNIETDKNNGDTPVIKILFLSANPADTRRIRIDEEIRAIDQYLLQQAKHRDRFAIQQHHAVRIADLQSALLRHEPDIVHFSGHGSASSDIFLENDAGAMHPVSPDALSRLFSILKGNIRCVVLNMCYSEKQAHAVAKHIDCVIGMSHAIGDTSAISFSSAFYQALGFDKDIKTAFDLGCVQIDLENLDEQDIPKLIALRANPEEIKFA